MELQKLPFDEALLQTFRFLTEMEKSMIGNFPTSDCAAVQRTCFLLAQMVVQATEKINE